MCKGCLDNMMLTVAFVIIKPNHGLRAPTGACGLGAIGSVVAQ